MTKQQTSQYSGVKITVAWVAVFVLFVGVAVFTVQNVSRSHGGGIEAEVQGTGTATGITCSRNIWALGNGWICRADRIDWVARQELPNRVKTQQEPYEVLSTHDLTGATVPVTSHLPMTWQSSGGRFSSYPTEIIVADGHPVGSDGWHMVQAFSPLVIVLLVTAIPITALMLLDRPRRRRKNRNRNRATGFRS